MPYIFGPLSITGSTVTISGSISTAPASGSSTTTVGPFIVSGSTTTLTGSLLISGSTTQTGNNTLIGNTVLSGSINVSGSTTLNGTTRFYGTHTLSGSNTITGNTTLSGSIEVSGSSNFHNSLFIVTGSTFIKGVTQISGSTGITGSFDVVNGNINIVSGSSFQRWGNKLFNYGGFSSTETQSGSANVSQSFTYNTTDTSNGITFTSGSRIVLENIGIYNLQFSAQVVDTGAGNSTIHIWLKKNGSNVANTATRVFLTANQETVTAWNWIVQATAPNDYYQIAWQTDDADTRILAATATGNFPAIPSVITTVTQIA